MINSDKVENDMDLNKLIKNKMGELTLSRDLFLCWNSHFVRGIQL